MRKFFTFLLAFATIMFNQLFSQNCNGAPPTTVTYTMMSWTAAGDLGNPGNSTTTLCGFPPNANIVGLQWNITSATATGDSWCSELVFDLDSEVNFTPYAANSGGPCGATTGGTVGNLQAADLEITANAAGCITIQAYLTYTDPPVGITGINGTLTFTACPQGIPLPINLKSINASDASFGNLISWTTTSETNNAFQIIERSSDGKSNWSEVARVSGTNTNKETTYDVKDENPLNISYYRLRSIDFDGKELISKIVVVRRSASGDGNVLSIHPNPTHDFANIEIDAASDDDVQVMVSDITGKLLISSTCLVSEGISTIQIPFDNMPAGLYLVTVNGAGINHNSKIVKE